MAGCSQDPADIPERYEGERQSVGGDLTTVSRDGSRLRISGDGSASVSMLGTYHEQVRDLELGDCVQVSGIVTNVDGDSIRMEAGELE